MSDEEIAMKKTQITDVDVTAAKVTLRVDGASMAIVRVADGSNFAWRVQFDDETLGSGVFANPERAIRWIASGRPIGRSDAVPDTTVVAVPYKMKATCFEDEAKEPDPEWEIIKREPRREPIWNGTMSLMPGGPALLDPTRLLRPASPAPAGVRTSRPRLTGANDLKAVLPQRSKQPEAD